MLRTDDQALASDEALVNIYFNGIRDSDHIWIDGVSARLHLVAATPHSIQHELGLGPNDRFGSHHTLFVARHIGRKACFAQKLSPAHGAGDFLRAQQHARRRFSGLIVIQQPPLLLVPFLSLL